MTIPSVPAQVAGGSRLTRAEPPRLVEQTRILSWLQFYVTLMILLVQIVLVGTLPRPNVFGDVYDRYEQHINTLQTLILTLLATALLLGTAAALLRRGYILALPLVILAEAAVAVDIWLAARVGILSAALVVLLAILGCWILVNLFRSEVLRFLLRASS
jgi:hypothetical protein